MLAYAQRFKAMGATDFSVATPWLKERTLDKQLEAYRQFKMALGKDF